MTDQPPILEYLAPQSPSKPVPKPLVVVLLCLPGLVCWALVGLGVSHVRAGTTGDLELPAKLGLVLWPFAVITAIGSIVYCWNKQVRWYVWVNAIINVPGLLLTAIFCLDFFQAIVELLHFR